MDNSTGGGEFLAQYLTHMQDLKDLHEEQARRCAAEMRVVRRLPSPVVNGNGHLPKYKYQSGHRRHPIPDALVLEIHRLHAKGLSDMEISRKLGMSDGAVYNIVRGRTHANLMPEQAKRSHLTAAGKQAIALAQRKRWAKIRKAKAEGIHSVA
jgi:hypothetical protein